MAHFYADIQGNRGQTTRMGTKSSGMDVHIRGWDVGARIYMSHNKDTGKDECTISLTCGSGHSGKFKDLGTFTADDLA